MVFQFHYIYQTPIHLAVKNNHTDAINLLINFGADLDWEDIFYCEHIHKGILNINFHRVSFFFY